MAVRGKNYPTRMPVKKKERATESNKLCRLLFWVPYALSFATGQGIKQRFQVKCIIS